MGEYHVAHEGIGLRSALALGTIRQVQLGAGTSVLMIETDRNMEAMRVETKLLRSLNASELEGRKVICATQTLSCEGADVYQILHFIDGPSARQTLRAKETFRGLNLV